MHPPLSFICLPPIRHFPADKNACGCVSLRNRVHQLTKQASMADEPYCIFRRKKITLGLASKEWAYPSRVFRATI